jgi:hypothetical protein
MPYKIKFRIPYESLTKYEYKFIQEPVNRHIYYIFSSKVPWKTMEINLL